MHQQRWHHRYLSLPWPFFLPPVFLLSHHRHSSSALIFPVCSSAAFRSSSPPFFISCQMISETSLIPGPAPSSFPGVDLSVSLCSWLSASLLSLCHSSARTSAFFSICLPLLFPSSRYLSRIFSSSDLTFHFHPFWFCFFTLSCVFVILIVPLLPLSIIHSYTLLSLPPFIFCMPIELSITLLNLFPFRMYKKGLI